MLIDHIFIISNCRKEADELVDFGMTEGSGRVHQGIGTANRRFFFDNFYLEILWVENELEARSVKDIGIWERSDYRNSGYSPYGLCLRNSEDTNRIFENSIKWKPAFLSEGGHVDIITSDKMPWIFRFPSNRHKNISDEPKVHKAGIKRLSEAIFNLSEKEFGNILDSISDNSIIEFRKALTNSLVLEFDNAEKGKSETFENFNLVIKY